MLLFIRKEYSALKADLEQTQNNIRLSPPLENHGASTKGKWELDLINKYNSLLSYYKSHEYNVLNSDRRKILKNKHNGQVCYPHTQTKHYIFNISIAPYYSQRILTFSWYLLLNGWLCTVLSEFLMSRITTNMNGTFPFGFQHNLSVLHESDCYIHSEHSKSGNIRSCIVNLLFSIFSFEKQSIFSVFCVVLFKKLNVILIKLKFLPIVNYNIHFQKWTVIR